MMRLTLICATAIAAVAICSGSANAQGHGGRIAAARAGAGNGNVNGSAREQHGLLIRPGAIIGPTNRHNKNRGTASITGCEQVSRLR